MTDTVKILSFLSLVFFTLLAFFYQSIGSNVYLFYGALAFLVLFVLLKHFKFIDYNIMGAIFPPTSFNVTLLKNEKVINEFEKVSVEITSHSLYRTISHNAVIITNYRFIISTNWIFKQSFKKPLSLYYSMKRYINPADKSEKYLIKEIDIKPRSVRLKLNDGDVFEVITNNEPGIRDFFEKIRVA